MEDRLKEAPCGYISMTHEGLIHDVNDTFLMAMGYEKEELMSVHIEKLMSTANKLIFHSLFYPQLHLHGKIDEMFISLRDKKGQSIPYLLNARRFFENEVELFDCILMQVGKRIHYEMELRTAKKQLEEAYSKKEQALANLEQIYCEIEQKQDELMSMNAQLLELSNTDKLTGLKNRRYFQEKLVQHMEQYTSVGSSFSLLIIDIDHFKRVNDTYGHQMGDYVLEKLASILKFQARMEDTAVRFGGEEFVLIMANAEAEQAATFADELRQVVADSSWEIGPLTISIGVATYEAGETEETLLKKADTALYYSKEHGRNQVTHYQSI